MAYELAHSPMVTAVKIYDPDKGQSAAEHTRYTTSMLLTDLSMGECRLHFVQGKLNDEINRMMVELCRSLGFRRIQFEVPHGTPATRHSTFVRTSDGLDRYTIDLQ